MSVNPPIKKMGLLAVDDHFFVRMGLACSLNAEPDLGRDGGSGQRFGEHRPDVVILDG